MFVCGTILSLLSARMRRTVCAPLQLCECRRPDWLSSIIEGGGGGGGGRHKLGRQLNPMRDQATDSGQERNALKY